jgi:omega-6 fatty acid desaturase (delta-12 desaturase)
MGSHPEPRTPRHEPREQRRARRDSLAAYQSPILSRSLGQLASTVPPYFALIASMYAGLHLSIWLTFALAFPAAGFVVRTFIVQHDCGHGSFFASRGANNITGWVCSLITFTPYANWRRHHAQHHAAWNNLDRRHEGADIYSTCLTVREYRAFSPIHRWFSRLVRHPLISQVLIPPLVFLVVYRFPGSTPASWRRERISVHLTNLALVAVFAMQVLTFGIWPVVLVHLPVITIAGIVGVWIFSVQHRFENALWARQDCWDPTQAALHGSSYLHLPRVLQWFTGNIGFHHLHHLVPRIPNYRLQACHLARPDISSEATALSFGQALLAVRYALWDEDTGRMVTFGETRRR